MPALTLDRELQLQATKWILLPGKNRGALGNAALAVLTADADLRGKESDWPGAEVLPETKALAELALAISACPPGEIHIGAAKLKDQAPRARGECTLWRAERAIDLAAEERRRSPAPPAPEDPEPNARDRWAERADLQ